MRSRLTSFDSRLAPRALRSGLVLAILIGWLGAADGKRAVRRESPSRAASIAAALENGLDRLGGFQDRCRAAGAWMVEERSWLEQLGAWQLRSGVLGGWTAAAATAADTLLAVLDPGGRVPRLDLQPYRIMTVRPADGSTASGFGMRDHPILHRRMLHKGMDFRGGVGAEIRAAAPGVVTYADVWSTYGNIVIIDHGLGVTTRYAHMSKIRVRRGDFVDAGARIGDIGATGRVTGPHLHFEVRYHGEPIDPRLAFVEPPPAGEPAHPETLGDLIAAWAPAPLHAR
jgi:murein DD-endopeptidase MepM/ murein hydrolase activator NlpD